jgi:hypothetical protein
MPSHLDCTESGDRPLGVSLLDVQGNAHADALADLIYLLYPMECWKYEFNILVVSDGMV